MSEQNKVRPFAVGDLAIIHNETVDLYQTGFIHTIDDDAGMTIFNDDGELWFGSNGKQQGTDHDVYIKTIRQHRKGGKEARDIVAMLCREYRKVFLHNLHVAISKDIEVGSLNKEFERCFWYDVKRGSRFNSLAHHKLYRKAKRMLGASDDN